MGNIHVFGGDGDSGVGGGSTDGRSVVGGGDDGGVGGGGADGSSVVDATSTADAGRRRALRRICLQRPFQAPTVVTFRPT